MSKRKNTGIQEGFPRTPALPSTRTPGRLALYACLLLVALVAAYWATTHGRHTPPAAPAGALETAPLLVLPPAEQALRATLTASPRDPAAHDALGRYLLDAHRPFEALWHFCAVQDFQPNDPTAVVALARALTQAGLPAPAISLLSASGSANHERVHEPGPDTEYARALAETALATARPSDALAALAGAGTALATSAPAQLLLGDARTAAGDTVAAQAAYRRAIALEPDSAAGYDRLGRLTLASGQWAAARKAFTAAREREPGEPGHLYRLGLASAGAGQKAEAERLWHEAMTLSPGYAPVRVALGKLYRDHRQWRIAAAYLVPAAKSDPSSEAAQLTLADVMTAQGDRASAYYQRGFNDLETDRPHLALAEFRRMTAAAPERVDGPLMTSLAYIQMQRLDLAAAAAQRGLDRHPRDSRLLARLAQLHTISHNRPLASRLCEQWLKLDPGAAEPALLLERIAREENRLPAALQLGERVLAEAPEYAAACYQMSKTLSAVPGPENQRRALALARQAAYRNPRETDHWQQLGVLLRGAGRGEEAAAAFLRALDLNPASVESCTLLVQTAAQEQRPETSRFFARLVTELEERARTGDALWRAVYARPDDAAAHARLAGHLIDHGELRRARYQLQQTAALRPTDHAARRDLAVVERLLALREK